MRATWCLGLTILMGTGACTNSAELPFNLSLEPQSVAIGPDEGFEATLTVASESGVYAGERVQLDVVQLNRRVLDELVEGDVRGAVDTFEPIDPEMSGLGVRWKRMTWTLGSDAPSRQRDLSWVCGEGVSAVYFFVTVDGQPVAVPDGTTWRRVRDDSTLEPPVEALLESELGLTDDRELEVLPVRCGELSDAGRDAGDADMDAGDGGRRPAGFEILQYGMARDGTTFFSVVADPQEVYRWDPGAATPVQVSSLEAIGMVVGDPTITAYVFSELSVTPAGAAVMRVQADDKECLVLVQEAEWTPVVCMGDIIGDGPVDRIGPWAVQASGVADFGALVQLRAPLAGGFPEGSFQLVAFEHSSFGGGTEVRRVVSQVDMPPMIESTSTVETMQNLLAGAGFGYGVRTFDAAIALYSEDSDGTNLLAWADMRATGGPVGDPMPPADISPFSYTRDNEPIDSLTTNGNDLAWVVKFLGADLSLLPGSGIYVKPRLAPPSLRVDLATSLPTPAGPVTVAHDISGLPAFQYALLREGGVILNARVDGPVRQGIWCFLPGLEPDLLISTGAPAPGRTPLTTLGDNIEIREIGPMVVSDEGSVAFAALLQDTTLPDASSDGAIIGINTNRQPVLLARVGDDLSLVAGTFDIDLLDLHSGALIVPPQVSDDVLLPGDFLGADTHDTHVVFGPGVDGHGASFSSTGCGMVVYRAGATSLLSENRLAFHVLPGGCF